MKCQRCALSQCQNIQYNLYSVNVCNFAADEYASPEYIQICPDECTNCTRRLDGLYNVSVSVWSDLKHFWQNKRFYFVNLNSKTNVSISDIVDSFILFIIHVQLGYSKKKTTRVCNLSSSNIILYFIHIWISIKKKKLPNCSICYRLPMHIFPFFLSYSLHNNWMHTYECLHNWRHNLHNVKKEMISIQFVFLFFFFLLNSHM